MKSLAIYRPADARFTKGRVYPREDYHFVSKTGNIFAVADGVTLQIEEGQTYPDPSPAGELARNFCERLVSELEDGQGIAESFARANKSVKKFKAAATTAFARINSNMVEWASVCDSYVFHFDKERNFLSRSPGCSPYAVVNGQPEVEEHLNTGNLELKEGELLALCTDGFEPYLARERFLQQTFVPWETEAALLRLEEEFIIEDPEKFGHERTLVLVWP